MVSSSVTSHSPTSKHGIQIPNSTLESSCWDFSVETSRRSIALRHGIQIPSSILENSCLDSSVERPIALRHVIQTPSLMTSSPGILLRTSIRLMNGTRVCPSIILVIGWSEVFSFYRSPYVYIHELSNIVIVILETNVNSECSQISHRSYHV